MTPPALTPEQRAAAAAKATAARAARARAKEGLRSGALTVGDVLRSAADDEALQRMRVSDLVLSVPGLGPVRAEALMQRLGIAPSRRLRGLGPHQAAALVAEFGGR